MMTLSVRENAALSALGRLPARAAAEPRAGRSPSVDRELDVAGGQDAVAARPSSPPCPAATSRRSCSPAPCCPQPPSLVADEPTQGVDVGARAEIYRILREVSDERRAGGRRVLRRQGARGSLRPRHRDVAGRVSSRPSTGDDVTEERLINAAVRATGHTRRRRPQPVEVAGSTRLGRFLQGDYAPGRHPRARHARSRRLRPAARTPATSSSFNITSVMISCAALGFIALGQTVALLIGGIDLSVGPLAGFLVVVGSFFLNDGKSGIVMAARLRADGGRRRGRRVRSTAA